GVGQGGKQNLGGLISGGTIVIGDYLTSSVSNSGVNPDGSQMKDALGNPVFQSSAYVNNQPPDAFDPTQFPAGNFPIVDSAGRQNRENGFPLVPTYQKADPSFQYSFFNLDPASGQYKMQTTPLFAKNFTLS